MFGRKNLYCTVENFNGVRIKDERQQDRNLLVEFRFEAPLLADLADEVGGSKLVKDLFDEVPDGFTPKAEMSQVNLSMRPGRQVVTLTGHPDIDAFAKVVGVAIKAVTVKKAPKVETWMLSWVMTFPLDDALMIGLIRMIRNGVYMTCELMDPKLFPDAEPVDDTTEARADEGGVGKTARRRGRPKKVQAQEPGSQPALQAANDAPAAAPATAAAE